ncbi:MAG TPA: response regulator [Candidatus Methanoperedens sp.]|nr:response regulator [Candidatus Methanoperedens sp.]
MTQEAGRETRIIRCPACRRYYRVASAPPAPGTRLRCTKCGEVFALGAAPGRAAAEALPAPRRAAPPRPRVLVATDGPDFRLLIGEVLESAGCELRHAGRGEETWEALGSWRPQVVLLDVALPGLPAFELCERLRGTPALAGTGVILIASVFQRTRYKRAPTSLYGADDYIEKHHIRDRLPGKVAGLLSSAPTPAPADAPQPPRGAVSAREQEVLVSEELPVAARVPQRQGLERLQESLRRFARIIVSDIALYNQDLVDRGVREGTFIELLAKEIEEGRRLYQTRVPPGAAGAGFFEEAVRDFVAGRAAGRGVPPSRGRGGHGRS